MPGAEGWAGSPASIRSRPPSIGRTETCIDAPAGVRPTASPSATSAGVIDSASFKVAPSATPPGPRRARIRPSGVEIPASGAPRSGAISLPASPAAMISTGPRGPAAGIAA